MTATDDRARAMKGKSVRQIVGEGWVYMARIILASVVLAVGWHLLRGGGHDMFGLRLMTAAAAVCATAVMVFGGPQGGVASLIFPGVSRATLSALMAEEIRRSEEQAFHPLQAVLAATLVGGAGLLIMLLT
jgi:hypothetical protein